MPMSEYYRALRERVGQELLLIPAVAAVLRDGAGRILVQRTHAGGWSLPAGAIEPGEAPAQALAREVREETGLTVSVQRVLGVFGGTSCRVTYENGDRVEYVVTLFECQAVGGELITSNEETFALEWFSPDALPKLTLPYPASVLRGQGVAAFFEWPGTGRSSSDEPGA